MRACLLAALLAGCDPAPSFGPEPAPSQRYAAMLADAGLDSTRAGRAWLAAGDSARAAPLAVRLPGAETLEAGLQPTARAWRLDVRRGEVLHVEVSPLADSARAFADLFAGDSAWLAGWAAGPDTLRVEWPVESDGAVVLRVWPELLAQGAASVRVWTAPSLAFPVADVDEDAIQSRWGAPRDGGARRHEGIDVFAPRGTPVLAGAAGRVSRVQETPIGGRVVWLQTDVGSLYYAHLDRPLVAAGDRVGTGDTLGTVGNTGNAAATPPHLHFGIYAPRAIDPEPFVVGRRDGPRTRR